MANYSNIIDRTGTAALMPEDAAREIIQGMPEYSMIMRLGRRLPDMARAQQRMPVLSALPSAYFVNGDTGLKQTTEVAWENKYLDAEELAVIVPIPESVLDDSDYDIWAQIRPWIDAALGKTFDAAVLHGTNAPASWPDDIVAQATAAGNVVALGTGADLYDDIMGEGGVIAKVEEDGFMVSGHLAALTMRSKLRALRDMQGQPLFNASIQETTRYQLDGEPVEFARNGALNAAAALLISGDFSQLVYAMRQDITTKLLDQAVIQNAAGGIIYNLAQQDMVALRVVMRLAWQVPNPINQVNQTEATRSPFAILTP